MSMMATAAQNQVRMLYALVLWEAAKKFARRSIGIFEELASIIIHVIGFSALRLIAGVRARFGIAIIAFMTSGIFLYWIVQTTIVPASVTQNRKADQDPAFAPDPV